MQHATQTRAAQDRQHTQQQTCTAPAEGMMGPPHKILNKVKQQWGIETRVASEYCAKLYFTWKNVKATRTLRARPEWDYLTQVEIILHEGWIKWQNGTELGKILLVKVLLNILGYVHLQSTAKVFCKKTSKCESQFSVFGNRISWSSSRVPNFQWR